MTFLADFIRETATIDVTVACLLFIILCPDIIVHLPFSNITNVTILSVVFFVIYSALRARFDLGGCLVDDKMIKSIVNEDDNVTGSFFSPKYAAATKDKAPTHVSPRLHPPLAAAHILIDGLNEMPDQVPNDTADHNAASTNLSLRDDNLPEECSPVVHEDFQENFTQDVNVSDDSRSPSPSHAAAEGPITESSDNVNW